MRSSATACAQSVSRFLLLSLTLLTLDGARTLAHAEPGSDPALRNRYVGFGPTWLSNLGTTGIAYGVKSGVAWDTSSMLIQLGAEGQFQKDAFAANGGLGLKVFLPIEIIASDLSPYIEGRFGMGLAARLTDPAADASDSPQKGMTAGFHAGAGAGVQFLRNSDVHLDLGLHWGTLLSSNSVGRPSSVGLNLEFYF